MSYLEELLPEFRKGAKIRCNDWEDSIYIQKDGETVVNHNNYAIDIPTEDILSDQWELYKVPEIDWDYIIKNKCLCWFWDGEQEENPATGILTEYRDEKFNGYRDHKRTCWNHCRPVRKDEVTFYEDKEKPEIGSLYKGGIYIGECNGKEVIMCLKDEPKKMTWYEAMKIEGRRPLSVLEWEMYKENREIIDKAIKKYGGEPLEGWYWSSSETSNNFAWDVRPSDGSMSYGSSKGTSNRVRCVLAF